MPLYGEVTNLIQYSNNNNFIVFHNYTGNQKEGYVTKNMDTSILKKLASKIGKLQIKSDVVEFFGDIGNIKKSTSKEISNWVFQGQIGLPFEKIKKHLEIVSEKFKEFSEVDKIRNWQQLSSDELFDNMKSLTTKVGAEILTNVTSELFEGIRKTPKGHPKIEGLVVPFGKNLIKITGNFAEVNQTLWKPLKLNKSLKEFNTFILENMLKVPKVSAITKKTWEKSGRNARNLLLMKNKKFYSDEKKFIEKINTSSISKEIDKTFKKLKTEHDKIVKTNKITP